MGFESMSVAELRDELVRISDLTREEVDNIKGKANIVYELTQRGYTPKDDDVEIETIMEEVEFPDARTHGPENTDKQEPFKVTMDQGHPSWTQYVLEQFAEDELFEFNGTKYPSVAGLRRVAEILLGDITFSGAVDVRITHPTESAPLGCCSVLYELQILWKLGMPDYIDLSDSLPVKTFRGLAGANQSNTDNEYAIYPEAIAEVRAEGRALRKALGLKNVVAREEITTKKIEDIIPSKTSDWNPEEPIGSNQKAAILAKCGQFDIDIMKFINSGTKQYASIDEVSKETAAKMIKELSAYQQNNETSKEIPESIKVSAK